MKSIGFLLLAIVGTVLFLKHRDSIEHLAAAKPAIERTTIVQPRLEGGEDTFVQLGSDEPRKFDLTIQQIIPVGNARAQGSFYDVAPTVTTEPEWMHRDYQNSMDAGEIYISGLSDGLIDHQRWEGWLVRKGAKTFMNSSGTYQTLPWYHVIPEPTAIPYVAERGDWMWHRRSTMLSRDAKSTPLSGKDHAKFSGD